MHERLESEVLKNYTVRYINTYLLPLYARRYNAQFVALRSMLAIVQGLERWFSMR